MIVNFIVKLNSENTRLRNYMIFTHILFEVNMLIPVSDIYLDDGCWAGMKNEIRVRPW